MSRKLIVDTGLTIRGRHCLNPDTVAGVFHQNIWPTGLFPLRRRNGISLFLTMQQQSTREVHLPKPRVKVAANLSQKIVVSVRAVFSP